MTSDSPLPMLQWSNLRTVVPLVLAQSTIYLSLNQRSLDASVATPATWLDTAVGFQTWTVWPYLILMAMPMVLALLIRQRECFQRAVVAYLLSMSVTFGVFIIWPTHCPRPEPPQDHSLSSWAYRAMIELDGPGCAFPSGHIVVPTLLCWAIWQDRHPYRWQVLLSLLLCAPAVLTTKQHHTWDLVGGLALASAAIAMGRFLISDSSRITGR